MKRYRLRGFALAAAVLMLAGCGSGGMQLEVFGKPQAFSPQASFVTPNSSGGHSIQIVNYPVEMGETYDYSKIRATKEGQYRLDLMLVKEAVNEKRRLATGEYRPQPHSQAPRDKLVRVSVYGAVDGREQRLAELNYDTLTGVLHILAVEGDTVRGRIDAQGDSTVVAGDFQARLLR